MLNHCTLIPKLWCNPWRCNPPRVTFDVFIGEIKRTNIPNIKAVRLFFLDHIIPNSLISPRHTGSWITPVYKFYYVLKYIYFPYTNILIKSDVDCFYRTLLTLWRSLKQKPAPQLKHKGFRFISGWRWFYIGTIDIVFSQQKPSLIIT